MLQKRKGPMTVLMTRAFDALGTIADIKDVASGKACNCICIGCLGPVWAKKGPVKTHHFAHEPSHLHTRECDWHPETEIHILAKEVLAEDKKLLLPIGTITPRYAEITFEHVLCEFPEGRRIPDVIGFVDGEKILLEIAVTHFCDKAKVVDLKRSNSTCLELDFSEFIIKGESISKDEIRNHMRDCQKKWLSVAPAGGIAEQIHAHDRGQVYAFHADFLEQKTRAEAELNKINETLWQARQAGKKAESMLAQLTELDSMIRKQNMEIKANHEKLQQVSELEKNEAKLVGNEATLARKETEFAARQQEAERRWREQDVMLRSREAAVEHKQQQLLVALQGDMQTQVDISERESALQAREEGMIHRLYERQKLVDLEAQKLAEKLFSDLLKTRNVEIAQLENHVLSMRKHIEDIKRTFASYCKFPAIPPMPRLRK